MTSPARTFSALNKLGASTTPVAAPAISNSSSDNKPGCSAVSPPIKAVFALAQPEAIPLTMSAMRSGTTLPTAM
ncbi:unannotated protein [freshwater metagenome]|uniref:Unannotated protein n=1 Tax=freshwater metagenome TaxID=449393 RepID=A0A6J7GTB9_9ZZZZ